MAKSQSKTAQNKADKNDQMRKDEYDGKYKLATDGVSEAEKWAPLRSPSRTTSPPYKNLKKVGG